MIKIDKIYLASQNTHKHKEISVIFKSLGFAPPLLSPISLNVDEYGKTFEENSLIKAIAFAKKLEKTVLADDSGLIIDALPNELGIYSARYKAELSQKDKNLDILKRLQDLPHEKRTARFISVVTIYNPTQEISISAKGIFEGYIAINPSGVNGFGYDPIFIPKGYSITTAELTEDLKNQISHRALSVQKLLALYKKLY